MKGNVSMKSLAFSTKKGVLLYNCYAASTDTSAADVEFCGVHACGQMRS